MTTIAPSVRQFSAELAAFGMRVRELRTSRGMTQLDLAQAAGLDRKTVSRVENARFSPTLANVFAIALGLGVSIQDLIA